MCPVVLSAGLCTAGSGLIGSRCESAELPPSTGRMWALRPLPETAFTHGSLAAPRLKKGGADYPIYRWKTGSNTWVEISYRQKESMYRRRRPTLPGFMWPERRRSGSGRRLVNSSLQLWWELPIAGLQSQHANHLDCPRELRCVVFRFDSGVWAGIGGRQYRICSRLRAAWHSESSDLLRADRLPSPWRRLEPDARSGQTISSSPDGSSLWTLSELDKVYAWSNSADPTSGHWNYHFQETQSPYYDPRVCSRRSLTIQPTHGRMIVSRLTHLCFCRVVVPKRWLTSVLGTIPVPCMEGQFEVSVGANGTLWMLSDYDWSIWYYN